MWAHIGQMVSVVAFYPGDPSSNPAGIYSFYSVKLFEKHRGWTIFVTLRPIF